MFCARTVNASNFGWTAPESCPSEASVRARLERDFGADFETSSGVTFEAVVTETRDSFELLLGARARDGQTHERRIRAVRCDDLVDALAAAMALARQSLDVPEPTKEPRAGEPSRETEPASPVSAPAMSSPAPASENGGLVPVVVLGALFDVGALPEAALGAEALAALEWPSVDVGLFGALTIPQQASFESGAGEFELAFGGAFVCYSPERSTWELSGCFAGEVGRIRGVGVDVANAREGSSPWLALVPSARLRFRPSPRRFGLYLQAGAAVPLARRPFELTDVGIVHRPAPVGLRSVAGIELAFQ
jgi:hypothetical protein